MKLKGASGAIISVEEYFKKEIAFFIENCEIEEHEKPVEKFKDWINEDSDFVAVNDSGDRIENELSAEEYEYYNSCYNAAIKTIEEIFQILK